MPNRLMEHVPLLRRLAYVDKAGEHVEIGETALVTRPEPLVVLGEAGMGKSTLLRTFNGQQGHRTCTARQLINAAEPRRLLNDGDVLVIDALDEVATTNDGDAVDLVLRRLGALDYPRFIMSCRTAEWRSATAMQGIKEQYSESPLELHLLPFNTDDARAFLKRRLPIRAQDIVEHFVERGLEDLLGNPQTLKMIADVAAKGELPDTISEIFERAIGIMQHEHREEKAHRPLNTTPPEVVLDAVGAAFAALILTGSNAVTRRAVVNVTDGDLPCAAVATLPHARSIGDLLESRLWRPEGVERFTYAHRRIGEFLGARWLAKYASAGRTRKRLLARFRERGLVPASLRGVHAWLAYQDQALTLDVIGADPMGVIEYGDADRLTVEQGQALLQALEKLAGENPRFRNWGRYSLRGVMQDGLRDEVRRVITAPATAFALRTLLLDAIKGSTLTPMLSADLQAMLLDTRQVFAVRSSAGKALAALGTIIDWPLLIEQLRSFADEDSVRLALELFDDVGFEHFSDLQIVEVVFAQVGASLCAVPRTGDEHTVGGMFWGLEKRSPDNRLDGLLDGIAEYASALHDREANYRDAAELTDIAFTLIARRVALNHVDPLRLWRWMEPFDAGIGYHREAREAVATYLRAHHGVRHVIQRFVLLDQPGEKTLWQRAWRLERRSPALSPSIDPQDLILLLGFLGQPAAPTEHQVDQWRDLVQLAGRGPESGVEVRAAARPFLTARGDLLTWLNAFDELHVPEWESRQAEQRRKAERKRRARWAEHRRKFAKDIDKVRAGEWNYLLAPSQAYLRLFSDIGDTLPAHERISDWLGPELQDAAFAGFEAFLHSLPPLPTANDIAESHADGKRWSAAYILVAAIAERFRGVGLSDLPVERLQAAMLELRQTWVDDHAKLDGLSEAIEAELRLRHGAWEQYWRLQVEPQLAHRRTHIDGMYELMRSKKDIDLAVCLSREWLSRFPDMPVEPEQEMIDRLLLLGQLEVLLDVGVQRRVLGLTDSDERRRNWDAVELLVNFETARTRLGDEPEPELLWHLRARLGERRRDGTNRMKLTVNQSAWIVRAFRAAWPVAGRPGSVSVGDTNAWDATEYIHTTISRLGDDPSDTAIEALDTLRDAAPDGYTETLRYIAAEQRRKRAEAEYRPPTITDIAAILTEGPPTDAADLQAIMLDALDEVQARLKGDPLNWYTGFYTEAGGHKDEETCRDELLKMLDGKLAGIELRRETHLADDKRADIECSVRPGLMLPIEVKGQWHRDLWIASDRQLDHLYVNDWRAERGIYLVLWFGRSGTHVPARAGHARPDAPDELRDLLITSSAAAKAGRVAVVVIDLTRPPHEDM